MARKSIGGVIASLSLAIAALPANAQPRDGVRPQSTIPVVSLWDFGQGCVASGGMLGAPRRSEAGHNWTIFEAPVPRVVSVTIWSEADGSPSATLRYLPHVGNAEISAVLRERQSMTVSARRIRLEFVAGNFQAAYCYRVH